MQWLDRLHFRYVWSFSGCHFHSTLSHHVVNCMLCDSVNACLRLSRVLNHFEFEVHYTVHADKSICMCWSAVTSLHKCESQHCDYLSVSVLPSSTGCIRICVIQSRPDPLLTRLGVMFVVRQRTHLLWHSIRFILRRGQTDNRDDPDQRLRRFSQILTLAVWAAAQLLSLNLHEP